MKQKTFAVLACFLLGVLLFSVANSAQQAPIVPLPAGEEAENLSFARQRQAAAPFDFENYEKVGELIEPTESTVLTRAVAEKDGYAYLLTRTGLLYTYDASSLSSAESFTSLGEPIDELALKNGSGLLRFGDTLYAFGSGGLEVVDISNPANPTLVNNAADLSARSAARRGTILVLGGNNEVVTYNIANPTAPLLLDSFDLPSGKSAFSVGIFGTTLYVGEFQSGNSGLRVLNMSNPSSLSEVNYIPQNEAAYHLRLVGGALVICKSAVLELYNLDTPATPQLDDSVATSARACAVDDADIITNGKVHRIEDGELNEVNSFTADFNQVDGFPYGTAVADDLIYIAQSPRVLVLRRIPPSYSIDSTYAYATPSVDGRIDFGEWQLQNRIELDNGYITVLNDNIRLYILVNMLDDNTNNDEDYYWLTFDNDQDGAITPNVDLNYGTAANTTNMRFQYYLGAGTWTGLQPVTRSSRGEGFGCFFADGSLSFSFFPNISCNSHRVYEFGIDLDEIDASVGDTVRMGLRVNNGGGFQENIPTNFHNDFSDLIEVELATGRGFFPAPTRGATIGLQRQPVEVTQAIQTRSNSLPLVEDKDTVARVYLSVGGAVTSQPSVVYLYGSDSGTDLPGSPLATYFSAPTTVDRDDIRDTANFALPSSWPRDTVTFQPAVRDFVGNSSNGGSFNLGFTEKERPLYWVVPVNGGSAASPNLVDNATIAAQESYLETVYPVADVRFVRKSWEVLGPNVSVGNTIAELNDYYNNTVLAWLLTVIFTGNQPYELPDQIYGFNTSGGGISDPTWYNNGAGRVSRGYIGSSREGTMAHEINHNLDTSNNGTWGRHVPNGCGAGGPDPLWPYANDDIQQVGFDTREPWVSGTGSRDTVIPSNYPDFMSYCQSEDLAGNPLGQLPTKWISPYRWENLFNSFNTVSFNEQLRAQVQAGAFTDVFYVTGQVNKDNTGSINPVLIQPGIPNNDDQDGDYALEFLDESDNVLTEQRFSAVFVDPEGDPIDSVFFNFQIPAEKGVSRILLKRNGDVLDELTVSDNAPELTILSPEADDEWAGVQTVEWETADSDGDDVEVSILYSTDGGSTFYPVAAGLTGNSYEMDMNDFPGSEQAMLRLIATDGFNTTTEDSALFSVADGVPEVIITSPASGTQVESETAVTFSGTATDAEDGDVDEMMMVWSIEGGDPIGNGQEMTAVLPDGVHTILLTATDSNGNSSSDSITIIVGSGNVLYLPFVVTD